MLRYPPFQYFSMFSDCREVTTSGSAMEVISLPTSSPEHSVNSGRYSTFSITSRDWHFLQLQKLTQFTGLSLSLVVSTSRLKHNFKVGQSLKIDTDKDCKRWLESASHLRTLRLAMSLYS